MSWAMRPLQEPQPRPALVQPPILETEWHLPTMISTTYRRLLVVILAFGLAMTLIFAIILLGYHEAYHTEADQTVNRRLAQQYADARLLITDEPLTVLHFHEGIDKLA